ncbi:hypothetical protein HNP81_002442 [Peribacillus huizhouensis]|uniref:Uncharacterized protein n=1 Tax=Peribacillus huizhouensis TaxID=1501239 RepID=A0ABR6CQ36_9BACI|nr:hypothetical protein [Peribacillus huizhouensis]
MPEMSEFWGFSLAPYISIVGITILALFCLFIARTYVKKL